MFFDNREFGIKENYNVTRFSEFTGKDLLGSEPEKKFLAKRIRAHDGCLGIMRRRRTRQTAISHGEPSTGFDPWISEWGNPLVYQYRRMNSIVRRSDTGGSETSQYPKEKKSSEIAQVVASERAGGQTEVLAPRGCGTPTWHSKG